MWCCYLCSDYLFKLLLIGDSGVGKSCLLLRFAVSYLLFVLFYIVVFFCFLLLVYRVAHLLIQIILSPTQKIYLLWVNWFEMDINILLKNSYPHILCSLFWLFLGGHYLQLVGFFSVAFLIGLCKWKCGVQ